MRKGILFILLFFFIAEAFSQVSRIKGKVVDASTQKPLAFVNVVINNSNKGSATDIDGKFSLEYSDSLRFLRLSYVGYHTKRFKIPESYQGKVLNIKMTPSNYQLDEFVVLPGKNPAHRIIENAVENKKDNNPERSISFKFKSYNKLVFTADLDSSILNNPDTIPTLDTSDQKAIDFFQKNHLFLMESVTERKHIPPDKSKETIIANRISGFQNPTFSMIASEMQSFSFYEEFVSVGGNKYLNPISKGSVNKYFFLIEDTLYSGADSVFVISYRPKKGKNFKGIKGVLSISTDGFALKNVIAEPAEGGEMEIRIQQQYQKVQGKQWFPVQLNTFLKFNFAEINNFKVIGIGRSYIKEVEINPEINKRKIKNVAIELDPKANERDEEFWNKYRQDSLTMQERNTYELIDSVGKAEKFEEKIKLIQALSTGKWPVKFIDLDLTRIMDYNDYEGFRFGMGINTNYKVSDVFDIGGYFGFGLRDKAFKYGGNAGVTFDKSSSLRLSLSYKQDVVEAGNASFMGERESFLTPSSYRDFFIKRMDSVEKYQGVLSFRALRHFKWHLFGNKQYRYTTNDYFFRESLANDQYRKVENFELSETGLAFRFAYKEKFYQTLDRRKISLGTKYPVFYGKITKGWEGLLDGHYDYWRYDLKVNKKFTVKGLGEPRFQLFAGMVKGNVPSSLLQYGRGVFTQFSIAVDNGFETMNPNEFLSDQWASLFLSHNFKNLLLKTKHFRPEFVLRTGIGFGSLNNPESHSNINFKTMEHGYYESGLQINNLLRSGFSGIGIGGFYRYGPYTKAEFKENIAVKITASFLF